MERKKSIAKHLCRKARRDPECRREILWQSFKFFESEQFEEGLELMRIFVQTGKRAQKRNPKSSFFKEDCNIPSV